MCPLVAFVSNNLFKRSNMKIDGLSDGKIGLPKTPSSTDLAVNIISEPNGSDVIPVFSIVRSSKSARLVTLLFDI